MGSPLRYLAMKLQAQIFAAVLAALPLAASAQPVTPTEAQLTVVGDGVASRSPDRARVFMDIVTNDDAAARSGGQNTTIYNAFLARATSLGIPAADVKTTSYNVSFVPSPPKNLPPAERQPRYGYITTRSLSVNVTPLENVGKVIDAATAAGVTNIGDVSFDLKDRHGAYLAALAAAMKDAKSTATALAEAGGLQILHIRSVTAGSEQQYVPTPVMMKARVMTESAPEPPTEIAPSGPIDVSAHVTVTYAIR